MRICVMVIDNKLLSAGVTQWHSRLQLKCNSVTPASSGSLANMRMNNLILDVAYP